MDNKVKNILQSAFWAAVAVVLVWFCVKAIDWKEFLEALRMCKWGYVVAAVFTGGFFIAVRGLRWHMLIKHVVPSIRAVDVVNAYGIGFLANIALPRAGEVVKLGYVVKNAGTGEDGKKRLSWDAAIGTYLAEKGVDAVVFAALVVVFFLGCWDRLKDTLQFNQSRAVILAVIGIIILGIAVVVLSYVLRGKGGLWGKIWGFVSGIIQGLKTIGKLEKPLLFILYTVSIWFSFWLTSALIIWALNDVDPFTVLTTADALNLTVTGSITTLVPVPGGFGAYHGAVATVMQVLYDIPMGSGLIYATLNHESQVLAHAITGLWCYIHQTFIRK
ncbi:MAG: flippase-like domain-containing protein [Bacteroidales bacterium]|nr:flippase-like domain-containing protein [Bacteroidales bacterium]